MRAKFELLEELIFARLCSDFRGNYLVLYVSGEENRIPLQRDGSSEGAATGMGSFAISLLQLHLTPMLVAQAEFCPKACFFTAEPEGAGFPEGERVFRTCRHVWSTWRGRSRLRLWPRLWVGGTFRIGGVASERGTCRKNKCCVISWTSSSSAFSG